MTGIHQMDGTRFRPAAERDERHLEVSLDGYALLENPLLNKGSAFPEEERRAFGLLGLLPSHISTIEEQLARTYENYRRKESDLERYIFLVSLQDRNETLFYRLLREHISEMTPIIYTPTVGVGCQYYSHVYRRPRGLYIPYPNQDEISAILGNFRHPDVRVIVVTDGERVLGLGDLGVGGMGIPVGKLSLYSLCAGIHPGFTLPILLDAGTDNVEMLADPLYLGWRRRRVRGQEYDEFIEKFIKAVISRYPDVLLQWEDFAKPNAARLLERYRDRLCTFNDDIQGTGAVALAGLMAASKVTGTTLSRQQVVVFGAGSSASGIVTQLTAAISAEGPSCEEARSRIWLVDRQGLIHSGQRGLDEFQQRHARAVDELAGWRQSCPDRIDLADVVRNVHPTVLIGTSAQPGAFTEDIVREMARHVDRPIIFPLSNPTSKSEASPADLFVWTSGRVLVATGSPFPAVNWQGKIIRIGQCNNALIFPGIGLGVLVSGAKRVANEMFIAAAQALGDMSPVCADSTEPLYPDLENVREVSRLIAKAVGVEAFRLGLAKETGAEEIEARLDAMIWSPEYVRYKRSLV